MKLLSRNLLWPARERRNLVLAVMIISAACCICGGLMAFIMAPNQAIQTSRIARLPLMDAEMVNGAAAGEPILVSGVLAGNEPLIESTNLVAYSEERWDVTIPTGGEDLSGDPYGRWQAVGTIVPNLILNLNGQSLIVIAANNVRLDGPLHETIVAGDSATRANYQGESLPDGTQRFRGLADGDLVTVWGVKASTGGVNAEQLFLGDRTSFEAEQRSATSALLYSGVCAMLLSPIILVGGLLYALFGRRR